ncbi:hypothetical protein ACJRO7_015823, partial [Eucalyptus globulus]
EAGQNSDDYLQEQAEEARPDVLEILEGILQEEAEQGVQLQVQETAKLEGRFRDAASTSGKASHQIQEGALL